MNINDVIKYPILTEKTYLQMQENVYTFAVDRRASKIEIKKAVEFIFQVKVASINTFNVPKKPKRVGRYNGFTNAFKKAIIKLESGKITIFPEEGITESDVNKEKNKEVDVEKLKAIAETEKKAAEKMKKAEAIKAKVEVEEEKTTNKELEAKE